MRTKTLSFSSLCASTQRGTGPCRVVCMYLTPHRYHLTLNLIQTAGWNQQQQAVAPPLGLYFTLALEGSLSLISHCCPNSPTSKRAPREELPDSGEQLACSSFRAALTGQRKSFHGNTIPRFGPHKPVYRPRKPSIRSVQPGAAGFGPTSSQACSAPFGNVRAHRESSAKHRTTLPRLLWASLLAKPRPSRTFLGGSTGRTSRRSHNFSFLLRLPSSSTLPRTTRRSRPISGRWHTSALLPARGGLSET